MKDKITERAALTALKPIMDHCASHRGAVLLLLKRLNKKTKKVWHRETVDRWLTGKSQPLLGIGLIAIEEGRKMIADAETHEENKGPGRDRPGLLVTE